MLALPRWSVTMMGTLLTITAPAFGASGSGQEGSRTMVEDATQNPASFESNSKERHLTEKRQSSGKQIIEEKPAGSTETEEKKAEHKEKQSSGTTLKFGSGGGGVSGATGR